MVVLEREMIAMREEYLVPNKLCWTNTEKVSIRL
jgi:hypothetical protein